MLQSDQCPLAPSGSAGRNYNIRILGAGGQALPAPVPRRGQAPRRLWPGSDHRVDPGQARLEDQFRFYRSLNLDFRQPGAAIGRRVTTVCKHEAGLRQQLTLFHVCHNFVLPHASLRVPLPEPELVPGTGATKRWQPRTPAMAAGLTDRVWSVREVLLYRVPPWPQAQMS
jgi:hypothetical protein